MAYGTELRTRVIAYIERGGDKIEAAQIFQIGIDTVYRWLRRRDDLAARKPGPRGSRKLSDDALETAVKAQPDACLHELAATLNVSKTLVHVRLKRLHITHKKKFSV